jgi:hypothetical protein
VNLYSSSYHSLSPFPSPSSSSSFSPSIQNSPSAFSPSLTTSSSSSTSSLGFSSTLSSILQFLPSFPPVPHPYYSELLNLTFTEKQLNPSSIENIQVPLEFTKFNISVMFSFIFVKKITISICG